MPPSIHIASRGKPSPHGVRIELDRPAATYEPGEPITGRVHVVAANEASQQSLSIELQAHARGEANALAVVAEQPLFRGAWRDGEVGTYPFRMEAPRTAGAYRGHLFHLGVQLAAVLVGAADKPSLLASLTGVSMDEMRARAYPAAATPLLLRPDAQPLVVWMNADRAQRELQGRGAKLVVALVVLGLGLAALGVGAAMYLGVMGPARSLWALMPAGFGAIFVLAGLWNLFANLGEWMAERRIGIPAIAVQHQPASSGLDVSVRLAPGARVSGVGARVEVHETVTIDKGEDTTIKTHRIGEQAWELLPRSEPNLFGAELSMAALASFPPALGLPGARIEWSLVLTVRLPGWPDWNNRVTLDAYPGGVRPSVPAPYMLTFE